MRYTYEEFTNEKGIKVCKVTSHFAKKPVVGLAKCSPEDVYNREIGMQIAKARCDLKVAEKRQKNAFKNIFNQMTTRQIAEAQERKAQKYFINSVIEVGKARETLEKLI